MDNPKNQIAQKLKEASNVLVTVSANPTIDQLAAAIGLTLLLNKLDKHASAVFSGRVPSTIEFLRPEDTLEKNTDSLRDFIIALDKSKADKLRYKVEDKMVKIFITPYRTSITDQDLVFSQGDFNVDVVVGIGVRVREDLDQAIMSHGGILHDATVVSINTAEAGSIGSLNWVDVQASSLCEMIVAEAELLKTGLLDAQIATALLTGIVAETERFSNAKTTSNTMNASAKLMTAGANQQLVATELETTEAEPVLEQPANDETLSTEDQIPPEETEEVGAEGTLQVEHQEELPEPQSEEENPTDQTETAQTEDQADVSSQEDEKRQFLTEPPQLVDEVGVQKTIDPLLTKDSGDEPSYLVDQDPKDDNEVLANDNNENTKPDENQETDTDTKNDTPPIQETPTTTRVDVPTEEVREPESADEVSPVNTADEPKFIETPLQTLDTIEHIVDSPHVNAAQPPEQTQAVEADAEEPAETSTTEVSELDQAREAVQAAMNQEANAATAPPETVVATVSTGQTTDPVALPSDNPLADLPDIHIDPDTGNIMPDPTVISPNIPTERAIDPSPSSGLAPPAFVLPTNPIEPTTQNSSVPPPPPGPPPMMPPIPPPTGSTNSFTTPTPNPFTLPPA